jgi:hypothetical protein
MKHIEVVVVPTALEHVRRIDEWWQRERTGARDLGITSTTSRSRTEWR